MAFDLLFGKTKRKWALDSQLTSVPVVQAPAGTTPVADALKAAKEADQSLTIRPRGKGAVVTKKIAW